MSRGQMLSARDKEIRDDLKKYNGINFEAPASEVYFSGDPNEIVNVSIADDGIVYILPQINNTGHPVNMKCVFSKLLNMQSVLMYASEKYREIMLDEANKDINDTL